MINPDGRELQELHVFRRLADDDRPDQWRLPIARLAMALSLALPICLGTRLPDRPGPVYLANPLWEPKSEPGSSEMHRIMLLSAQSLACTVTVVNAAEIHVPQDFPSLQAAIDAANPGDSVIIHGGTHPGGIVVSGKAISVSAAPGTIATIDGAGSWGLRASDVPAPGLRLHRLLLRNCANDSFGSALRADASVIDISNCEFTGNQVVGGGGTRGGGALFASTCSIRIHNSSFIGNDVTLNSNAYPFGHGGAMMLDWCDLTVDGCEFRSNTVTTVVPGASWSESRAFGGAISARWSTGTLRSCEFIENRADSRVSGFGPLASAQGFALSLASQTGSGFEVAACRFLGNAGQTNSENTFYGGAGTSIATLCFGYPDGHGVGHLNLVTGCEFEGNRAVKLPNTNGAAIADISCTFDSSANISECTFARSSATNLVETLPGFGEWRGSVRSLTNPGIESTTLTASSFCGLDCPATGPEIVTKGNSELTVCCEGDLDHSREVDGSDLGLMLSRWGQGSSAEPCDLNDDGQVDEADLAVLLKRWGPCAG